MTTEKAATGEPRAAFVSRWASLPPAEQAKAWEEAYPGAPDRIMAMIDRRDRHECRMDWADVWLRLAGIMAGLGSIGIMGWTAMTFAANGAPTQGLGIFGAGSASIIAAFLTARRADRSIRQDT